MMSPEDQFDGLEQQLKDALQRQDAPQGFDARVLARLHERETKQSFGSRVLSWMRMPAARLAVTAALFVAVFGGVLGYQRYERRREAGEAARRELLLALRITGSKLQYAQERVNRTGAQNYGDTVTDSEKSQ